MTKPTQADRILAVLQEHIGEWTNGRYFIQTMMISQAHTRIFELQRKGYKIEASDFKDEYGFKSYRLVDTKEDPINRWNEAIKQSEGATGNYITKASTVIKELGELPEQIEKLPL